MAVSAKALLAETALETMVAVVEAPMEAAVAEAPSETTAADGSALGNTHHSATNFNSSTQHQLATRHQLYHPATLGNNNSATQHQLTTSTLSNKASNRQHGINSTTPKQLGNTASLGNQLYLDNSTSIGNSASFRQININ